MRRETLEERHQEGLHEAYRLAGTVWHVWTSRVQFLGACREGLPSCVRKSAWNGSTMRMRRAPFSKVTVLLR